MSKPLFHRVFLSRLNEPQTLQPAQPADSSVCVWDSRLQSLEHEAWIKHILRTPAAPYFEGYLGERLTEHS